MNFLERTVVHGHAVLGRDDGQARCPVVEDSDIQHVLISCLAFPFVAARGTVGAGGFALQSPPCLGATAVPERKSSRCKDLPQRTLAGATRVATGRLCRV
jgi:hypothetical protein